MNKLNRMLIAAPVCLSLCMAVPASGVTGLTAPTMNDVNQALQENDFAEMERLCREILEENAEHAQAVFMLGYALHAQGELDEAVLYHIRATSFPATAPLAYYNLGCAQALKGNTDQAFKALNKAVELGVTNAAQYRGDSDLQSLRTDQRWKGLLESMQPNLTASSSADAKDSKDAHKHKASGVTPEGLHFWVGEWDCYNAKDGKRAGTNKLSFRVNGLVIHEEWESTGGSYMGESWNFFDPIKKAWKQTWVGSGGGVTQFVADKKTDAEGVMFVGKAFNPTNVHERPMHKMHVRPIHGGMVRQTGSSSTDDGTTWTVKYDLIYVPKGEAFELEDLSI